MPPATCSPWTRGPAWSSAVDRAGDVFVSARNLGGAGRVYRYDASGALQASWQVPIAPPPSLPFARLPIAVDAAGHAYVLTGTDSQSPLAQAVYRTAGTRAAAVRVTAPSGRTATTTATVEARLAPPPGLLGASIDAGAQFTDTPRVSVRLVWRPFDTGVVISNDGGFAGARTFPIAAEIRGPCSPPARSGCPRRSTCAS
jgi:hypothetical protein